MEEENEAVTPKVTKRKKEDDIDKQLLAILSAPAKKKEQSPAELFLLSQVPILESLNPRLQSRAQLRIIQVLEDLAEQQEKADRPAPLNPSHKNSMCWDYQTQKVPHPHWDYFNQMVTSQTPYPPPCNTPHDDIDIIN